MTSSSIIPLASVDCCGHLDHLPLLYSTLFLKNAVEFVFPLSVGEIWACIIIIFPSLALTSTTAFLFQECHREAAVCDLIPPGSARPNLLLFINKGLPWIQKFWGHVSSTHKTCSFILHFSEEVLQLLPMCHKGIHFALRYSCASHGDEIIFEAVGSQFVIFPFGAS